MEIKNYIENNMLIIVPQNQKENTIKKISKLASLYSYKIMSDIEFKKAVFFDYDIDAISYLINKYGLKYSVTKEYLENMYYIEDIEYSSYKLNYLKELKKELIGKGLLKTSPSFYNSLKNRKVLVYGFDVITKELLKTLNHSKINYKIVPYTIEKQFVNSIYSFETMESEVDYVCYEISKLLQAKVDINKIKLANVNSDYYFTLQRYFKMYNIPLTLPNENYLFNLICVKDFYNKVVSSLSLEKALNYFSYKYENEEEIYSLLLSICNKLVNVDIKNNLNVLKELLKSTKTKESKYLNTIEIVSLDNLSVDEDEYVFVLSINQGIYPISYKNEDILSDKDKKTLSLDTSDDLNLLSKEKFKILLTKSPNMFLSFKEKTAFNSYSVSFIVNELNLSIIKYKKDETISYSKQADELRLAKIYDKTFAKSENEYEKSLAYNYPINYKAFSHKFKKFDKNKIKDYMLSKNKKLSYSALDNYFKCSFRYYMNNLLSLKENKDIPAGKIGNAFHKVLEDSFKGNFDFETSYQNEYANQSNMVKFYLDKFKNVLVDIIRINNENLAKSSLNQVLTEKKVSINYDEPFPIEFKGFVDKILYYEEKGTTYVAIIDYKTSDPTLKLEQAKYGLSLQLPIYLYFIKHSSDFKKVEVCGFYLQKLLPKNPKLADGYEKNLLDTIKLQGYSNSSFATLSRFDPGFANSNMIKSMSLTKQNSFNRYAKTLSTDEMNELAELVDFKVKEAISKIADCDFDINPKMLDGKNQSCNFCEFKECCFFKHDDLIYLNDEEKDDDDEDVDEEYEYYEESYGGDY